MGKHIDLGAVRQRVRDLVRIKEINSQDVPPFVKNFIRTYDIPSMFRSELEDIAYKELAKGDTNEKA